MAQVFRENDNDLFKMTIWFSAIYILFIYLFVGPLFVFVLLKKNL